MSLQERCLNSLHMCCGALCDGCSLFPYQYEAQAHHIHKVIAGNSKAIIIPPYVIF